MVRVISKSNATAPLCKKRKHEGLKRKTYWAEAETIIRGLQANECQGLPATQSRQGWGQTVPWSLQKEVTRHNLASRIQDNVFAAFSFVFVLFYQDCNIFKVAQTTTWFECAWIQEINLENKVCDSYLDPKLVRQVALVRFSAQVSCFL